jgi:predicted helicase
MSFQSILKKYRTISFSERDKGNRFERLMQAYLKTDPQYAALFKNVWLWNDFFARRDLGGSDTGIDLVAQSYDGDYWAIQCKCFDENAYIDKAAVDSFISTANRSFRNDDLLTTRFSHLLWISTTNNWSRNALESVRNQGIPFTRINLINLIDAPVDWDKLEQGIHGEQSRVAKKSLRDHQTEALERTHEHFKSEDRGKLIMACGTGKTFTSLRIAENETKGSGLVLFLVPSIALLGQTLREWSSDADQPINAICICSDPEISQRKSKLEDSDSTSIVDLAMPASTDPAFILRQFRMLRDQKKPGMTVVFSTYQSIDVIARVQKVVMNDGFGPFDLIICDEAHRTTGITLSGEDESAFTKVHDNTYLQARKRLYMTATPRLFSDDAQSKAAEAEAMLCSMDDEKLYGKEMYRIGFGEAVERGLLTDYKVLILTLNDRDVPPAIQRMITDGESEIDTDDASKLIGCINALSKQFIGDGGETKLTDPEPMRRAVAFCQNIKTSKKITAIYNTATDSYLQSLPDDMKEQMVSIASKHADGTMSAPERDELLGWLKAPIDGNECRIITNVRVLSEGVDVPSLDAVMFLSARNSQVDVVQSVGRVMRKSPGKKYGYIIIPVVVPTDVEANKALDNNERYKVVWTVLNALRAHDDRFNAIVNKIELNKKRPAQILVGGPGVQFDGDGRAVPINDGGAPYAVHQEISSQILLQFEQLQQVVFARLVQKVGDRRYWEQWAKDVAIIAERQIERITYLVTEKIDQRQAFEQFLGGLQKNINPAITHEQAIDMLAQHIITRPIFEALFEGYSFVKNNPVSSAMQAMLDALEGKSIAEESDTLQKFYDSVRKRAAGIDNAEGKQRIIIELYDKFFKTAFPKMVDQLGIVYTPVEVVDFIIHSVNDILRMEFGRSISDENVHILDPFTGTGTFVTRLLQSGLVDEKDITRKYQHELHANEIVLLAYYIAAVNIENAYHDQLGEDSAYEPFEGIVLTDTFQLGETDVSQKLFSEMFPQNSARVARQKKAPLRVIMGNPPYSIGQKSANDNAQNQNYEKLDSDIAKTYAKLSSAGLNKSLYDAYIKAFRWSTDRLDPKHGGIIAFVSNGAWLDGNSTDGFRKSLEKDFSSIWVFNTRGNARTQGELRRKEAGNVFGGGSRTPIAITLLVKKPQATNEQATIHYHDIGDYLSREEKLAKIAKFKTVANAAMTWKTLEPNAEGDWLNQRNDVFDTFIPMAPEKKFDSKSESFFNTYAVGANTARDAWAYNFSFSELSRNMKSMVDFYNSERLKIAELSGRNLLKDFNKEISSDSKKISWSVNLKKDLEKGKAHSFDKKYIITSSYRPFCKQKLYFHKPFIERPGLNDSFFPNQAVSNQVICVSPSPNDNIAVLITDSLVNFHFNGDSQCFPSFYYEERQKNSPSLFDAAVDSEYIRRDGVSDFILERAKKQYGKNVGKEDIFYYIYGILHSPDYRTAFANDLKKMLPRIPLVEDVRDFWKFSKAGRALAELHINYESVPPYDGVQVTGESSGFFTVEKMRYPKKGQTDSIIYNSKIVVSNIPAKAYEYVVNGKSAIDWIMERYAVTINKDSGIKNDPNDWANEVGKPRYILDLLLSIINVSVQTVDIVASLPKLHFDGDPAA